MIQRLLLLNAALLALALPARADDAQTLQMYQRYEHHIVRPQAPAEPLMQSYHQDDVGGFQHWLFEYKQRAEGQGLDPMFLSRALSGISFNPRVIELDQKQPESKITFEQYKKNILSKKRIADGRDRLHENWTLLNRVSRVYGVPPQYIVALWGIETNYGRITGGFDILSSLATLAYEGRRADFFEKELTNALSILAGGHAGTDQLTGSWAGAMGQCQFMPSSYLKYGADGDGDGIINIWSSMPDVFASMANYLATEGWDKDQRWGREVIVPRAVPASLYGRDVQRPLSYWIKMGVRQANGRALPKPAEMADFMASLVAPDGPGRASYLVYGNYNVIMHWNRSTYFATSVGLLADAIASRAENQ